MAMVVVAERRVLILGGSGVLGGAIGRHLVKRGANVVLAGRDETRLKKQADVAGASRTLTGDLGTANGPAAIVSTAVELLGGLDGIINAAGSVAFGSIGDLSDSVLAELIASNFTGPLRAMRDASRHIDGGFVVSVSGAVVETPTAGMAAYSGAKAGLSAATSAMGRELRRSNIHVMDARPPHTETGLANRPLAGTPPALPPGLPPEFVAARIIEGLEAGRRELASADFAM